QAEDGIRDWSVTGVQTCALPIFAVGEDGAVRLFSAQTGAPVCATDPVPAGVRSAGFSPDGARFVVTGGPENVYIHASRDCGRLGSGEGRVGEEGGGAGCGGGYER